VPPFRAFAIGRRAAADELHVRGFQSEFGAHRAHQQPELVGRPRRVVLGTRSFGWIRDEESRAAEKADGAEGHAGRLQLRRATGTQEGRPIAAAEHERLVVPVEPRRHRMHQPECRGQCEHLRTRVVAEVGVRRL